MLASLRAHRGNAPTDPITDYASVVYACVGRSECAAPRVRPACCGPAPDRPTGLGGLGRFRYTFRQKQNQIKKRNRGFVYGWWHALTHTFKIGSTGEKGADESWEECAARLEVRNGSNNPIRSEDIYVFLVVERENPKTLEDAHHKYMNEHGKEEYHALLHRSGIKSEVRRPRDLKADGATFAQFTLDHFQTQGHENQVPQDFVNATLAKMSFEHRVQHMFKRTMEWHGASDDDLRTILATM